MTADPVTSTATSLATTTTTGVVRTTTTSVVPTTVATIRTRHEETDSRLVYAGSWSTRDQ